MACKLKKLRRFIVLTIFLSLFSIGLLRYDPVIETDPVCRPTGGLDRTVDKSSDEIVLVAVVCNSSVNYDELLVMIKSAILFQKFSRLRLIVLSEPSIQPALDNELQKLSLVSNSFSYRLMNISFPEEQREQLRKLEGILNLPCTTQRLFLPDMLPDENNILYVDTDTIFLNELSAIWSIFQSMNSSHISGLVLDTEHPGLGFYSRNATKYKYPVYGEQGLNAGVMFMNLSKMRQSNWVKQVVEIVAEYATRIRYSDQDIINIFFHQHPDKLYVPSCTYNYRAIHCSAMHDCKDVEVNGVSVLHGWGGAFQSDRRNWRVFRAIYDLFSQYEFGKDPYYSIKLPLEREMEMHESTTCSNLADSLLMNLIRSFPKPMERQH